MPPKVTLEDLQNQKQLLSQQQVNDTQKNDQVGQAIVEAIPRLIDYFNGAVSKIEVLNQLQSISTPDVEKVAQAISQLAGSNNQNNALLADLAQSIKELLLARDKVQVTNPVNINFAHGISHEGEYKPGTVYKIGQGVKYKGSFYSAIKETSKSPSTSDWRIVAEKGDIGLKGDKGDPGIQGPQGKQGLSIHGKDGKPGLNGLQGTQGSTGPKGEKGDIGATGPTGPQGHGYRGVPGPGIAPEGTTGQILSKKSNDDFDTTWIDNTGGGGAGSQGATGATGPAGAVGATGAGGTNGSNGTNGTNGATGATGAQGATGAGATGATGTTGNTGSSGATGATGPTGSTGLSGATGAAGNTGATGSKGISWNVRTTVATSVTAAAFDFIEADATAGAVTITFPTSPATGDMVAVKKTDSTANTVISSITVEGVTNPTQKYQYGTVIYIYSGSSWSREIRQNLTASPDVGAGSTTNQVLMLNGATPPVWTPTTVTSTPTASDIPQYDASANLAANNLNEGITSTATATGTTTLTVASTGIQVFTGTAIQTVLLPTTSVLAGYTYLIINQSTLQLTVQSSGANTVQVMDGNSFATFIALVNAPTSAANWNVNYVGPTTPQAITLVSNAATLDVDHIVQNVTNNSAAAMTLTLATTGASDGQLKRVRIFDSSAVAQGITLINTENSLQAAPTTSNGSTTLYLTILLEFNGATTKWRCAGVY